jgi:Uma2 family endonuclease
MAADPARRIASYQDIVDLPDHLVGEILAGELFVSPRPAPRHADTASTLGSDLLGPYHRGRGGPGGWRILLEPELHLAEDVLVPDWAGWRRERMPALPETAWFELAPDWICEVLSPSTARLDRAGKMLVYARHQVGWAWLVDPLAMTLEVFRNEGGKWLMLAVHAGDARVHAEPFAEIEIELAAWWDSSP